MRLPAPVVRRAALVLALLSPLTTAAAQGLAIFGAAEADENDQTLLLLGAAWHPNRLGMQPYVSVLGYTLRFDVGTTTISQNVIAPQVGLRFQNEQAATQIGVGYTFADDGTGVTSTTIESGDGPFAAFQWNHWGNPVRAFELLASYGFDTQFLWSRATGMQRLSPVSPLWVGLEAGLTGRAKQPDFWSLPVGALIEWRFSPAVRANLAGGVRIGLAPSGSGTPAYGRLGFLLLPGAR